DGCSVELVHLIGPEGKDRTEVAAGACVHGRVMTATALRFLIESVMLTYDFFELVWWPSFTKRGPLRGR
ncbi:MAG: hypothetical protein OXR73_21925, partial [Myxococcales bacterium]|nr:hypothetical protein [Myxococcales bacterium]